MNRAFQQEIPKVNLDDIEDLRDYLDTSYSDSFCEGLGPDAHTNPSWEAFEIDATCAISRGDDAELGKLIRLPLMAYLRDCAINKPVVVDPIFTQGGREL